MATANQRPAQDSNEHNNNQQPEEAIMNNLTWKIDRLHNNGEATPFYVVDAGGEGWSVNRDRIGDDNYGYRSTKEAAQKLAESRYIEEIEMEAGRRREWDKLTLREKARQLTEEVATERFVEKYGEGQGDDHSDIARELYSDILVYIPIDANGYRVAYEGQVANWITCRQMSDSFDVHQSMSGLVSRFSSQSHATTWLKDRFRNWNPRLWAANPHIQQS